MEAKSLSTTAVFASVTLVVMVTAAAGAWTCPDGWSSNNGNCYFVSSDKLHQPNARTQCQSSGGDLASISDAAEDAYIDSLLYVAVIPRRRSRCVR